MGACVCIPSETDRKNDLAGFVERSQANWALLTPTVAELLDPFTVPSFRFVTLGGESIHEATLQKWLQVCPVGINYGSAEVDVTHTRDVLNDTDVSNVGKRLPSCVAYIVDPENPGVVLPVGAMGELVISGPTMAREYLNAPTKTAQAFMTTPQIWLSQGIIAQDSPPWMSRIYRMGDLFRQRFDGSLEFVSRTDFQVKVNGKSKIKRSLTLTMVSLTNVHQAKRLSSGTLRASSCSILQLSSALSSILVRDLTQSDLWPSSIR